MSGTVSMEEAQKNLKELIRRMGPGDEVIITENHVPVARLVGEPQKSAVRSRPAPGLGKGMMTILSDDDELLRDFAEYMP